MYSRKLSLGLITVLAIFALTTLLGSTWAAAQDPETVLHSFNGTNGEAPLAGLIADAAGNLYGTTSGGGPNNCGLDFSGCGTVFELTPGSGGGWVTRTLHAFSNTGVEGYLPASSLAIDAAGNLYGTTVYGGDESCVGAGSGTGCGTVFELIVPAAGMGWSEKIVHKFENGRDGYNPTFGVTLDAAGNLYGTTLSGGANNAGMAYELSPAAGGHWTEKILHAFNSSGNSGAGPSSGLVLDSAGNLYGTTADGGVSGLGTAYELKPTTGGSWTWSGLYSFISNNGVGGYPFGPIALDGSGNLYGTTSVGGAFNLSGTIYQLVRQAGGSWKENVLFDFKALSPLGVTLDAAGNIYGVLPQSGQFAQGGIFELTPISGGWSERILYDFTGTGDGGAPNAGLLLDAAGDIYGTTHSGGTRSDGVVFEITP